MIHAFRSFYESSRFSNGGQLKVYMISYSLMFKSKEHLLKKNDVNLIRQKLDPVRIDDQVIMHWPFIPFRRLPPCIAHVL